MAGIAIAMMPQRGWVHHSFCKNPSPTWSKKRFSPPARSPSALLSSQRHTTPEAMNETAIGNR